MFDRREKVGFGLMAVLVTLLNIVFWLAVIGGTVLILKSAGVI